MKLVAFTKQVSHGPFSGKKSPDLGVLDVIGKDRRTAWQSLGDMSTEHAMKGFVILLNELCPLFKTFVIATKCDNEEKVRLKQEEELKKIEESKRLEELRKKEEEELLKQEQQRRLIQDALNQQTFYQFKAYAEHQYPGNPQQQGLLIRQLQEQHYHQYMQQLEKEQFVIEDYVLNEKQILENNSEKEFEDNFEECENESEATEDTGEDKVETVQQQVY